MNKLYRYEFHWVSTGYDEILDCSTGTRLEMTLREFEVIKETKKGKWISTWLGKRWVANTGKKRYAHPTPEEAKASIIVRKERYVVHCKNRLRRAEEEYSAACRIVVNEK